MNTMQKSGKHRILILALILIMVVLFCVFSAEAGYFSMNPAEDGAQFVVVADEITTPFSYMQKSAYRMPDSSNHNNFFNQTMNQEYFTEQIEDAFRYGLFLILSIVMFSFISISYIHKQDESSIG